MMGKQNSLKKIKKYLYISIKIGFLEKLKKKKQCIYYRVLYIVL